MATSSRPAITTAVREATTQQMNSKDDGDQRRSAALEKLQTAPPRPKPHQAGASTSATPLDALP